MFDPLDPLAIPIRLLAAVAGGATGDPSMGESASSIESIARDGLGLEIFLGLLAVAGAMLSRRGVVDRLGLRRGRLSGLENLLLMIGTLGASAALDGVLDLTQWGRQSALWEFERTVAGVRGHALLLALAAFVVAPAICEELLCRGLLQRGLVTRFGAPLGIVTASLVFGALHLDPIHAAFAAVLGLYLGVVCHLAGSLRSAIGCHLANNLTALLVAAYLPAWEGDGAVRLALGAAAAASTLWWVWRRVDEAPAGAHDT